MVVCRKSKGLRYSASWAGEQYATGWGGEHQSIGNPEEGLDLQERQGDIVGDSKRRRADHHRKLPVS